MALSCALNIELASRYARWLVAQKYALCSRVQYSRAVREYAAFLGKKPFTKSTHFDCQEYLAERAKQGASHRTLRGLLFSLRIFFDFLNLGGLVMWVGPRLVRPRPLKPVLPKVLTKEQITRLFAGTRTQFERAVLETLYGTGCRTGELRTMRIEDVDFSQKRIRVRGKRGDRFVKFTGRVLRSIRRYLGGRTSGYIFAQNRPMQQIQPRRTSSGAWVCNWRVFDEDGIREKFGGGFVKASKNFSYQQAVIHFAKLASRDRIHRPLGLQPISMGLIDRTVRQVGLRTGIRVFPYCLRHSFATHFLDNGADVRVVQELLGHANICSTQVYAHVSKRLADQTFRKYHPRA